MWHKPVFEKIMSFISPLINGVSKVAGFIGKGWDALFGTPEKKEDKPEEKPELVGPPKPIQLTAEEQAQAQKYAHAREDAEAEAARKKEEKKKKKSPKKSKKAKDFARLQEMHEETGDDYGENPNDLEPDDILPASYAPPARARQKKRSQGKAAASQPEVIQPQIQVDINISQTGIPDEQFAQGVINAIKSRQSDFENIISALVNEQARLAYG